MPGSGLLAAASVFLLAAGTAWAAPTFTVEPARVADEKAVFATVETRDVVPARVRTGGTIATLSVREGDEVAQGQVIATVGDPKLVLQKGSLDAQIAALTAQLDQAQSDLARAQALFDSGVVSRTRLDEATTAVNVASNQLKARSAERAVIDQQLSEGKVLAPTAGRVLAVPVTAGAVVMNGETIATVAQHDFILRLRVPERHARFLAAGDVIRVDDSDLPAGAGRFGTVTLVYPQLQEGRVIADASVAGLGDYFVGERVRVWISSGDRTGYFVPLAFILTRFGLDYVRLRQPDGSVVESPVQRGRERPSKDGPDEIEVLSGLHPGDVLVAP